MATMITWNGQRSFNFESEVFFSEVGLLDALPFSEDFAVFGDEVVLLFGPLNGLISGE